MKKLFTTLFLSLIVVGADCAMKNDRGVVYGMMNDETFNRAFSTLSPMLQNYISDFKAWPQEDKNKVWRQQFKQNNPQYPFVTGFSFYEGLTPDKLLTVNSYIIALSQVSEEMALSFFDIFDYVKHHVFVSGLHPIDYENISQKSEQLSLELQQFIRSFEAWPQSEKDKIYINRNKTLDAKQYESSIAASPTLMNIQDNYLHAYRSFLIHLPKEEDKKKILFFDVLQYLKSQK